jgi:hypothetical protein
MSLQSGMSPGAFCEAPERLQMGFQRKRQIRLEQLLTLIMTILQTDSTTFSH